VNCLKSRHHADTGFVVVSSFLPYRTSLSRTCFWLKPNCASDPSADKRPSTVCR
jgi:hypothetical protein